MRVIAGEFRSRRLKSIPGARHAPHAGPPARDAFRHPADPHRAARPFWTPMPAPARSGSKPSAAAPRTRGFWNGTARRSMPSAKISRRCNSKRRATVVHRSGAADHRATPAPTSSSSTRLTSWNGNMRRRSRQLAEAPPRLTVVQHSVRLALPEEKGALQRTRVVKQGDNALSFFRPRPNQPEPPPSIIPA